MARGTLPPCTLVDHLERLGRERWYHVRLPGVLVGAAEFLKGALDGVAQRRWLARRVGQRHQGWLHPGVEVVRPALQARRQAQQVTVPRRSGAHCHSGATGRARGGGRLPARRSQRQRARADGGLGLGALAFK